MYILILGFFLLLSEGAFVVESKPDSSANVSVYRLYFPVNSTQIESFPVEAGQDSTSFDLYTYLHDTEGTIHLQATAYDADNNVVRDHEFDVPLKRRMITKFSGPYFSGSSTSSSGITIVIGIDAEWEGEQEITY